ncbi:MarR family winged helix-turn-helix transcriptional regulator [Paraburkholderia fungorum]|uniref:MarR family winged helix-turn-helix transcriptional regulator n=1 Tax=Paraburkholderia fungorum TaxID=134537 RepID=UPI0038B6B5F3
MPSHRQLRKLRIRCTAINAAQYNLLCAISRLDVPTQSDLSALGHTLKPLIRDGVVESRKDDEDARKRRIALTEAGETKLHDAEALWKLAQRRFASLLGRTVSKELRELLDQIASPDFAEQLSS